MSRLWTDKLQVTLCPDRMELVRSSGGLRSRILESQTIPCDTRQNDPLWAAAVAALKQRLLTLPTKHHVTVTLSNHFVHYALVPWSDALVNDEERLSLARICFEKTYGDLARHWAVRVSHAGYGQPCLASAVDQALVDGIQNAFTSSHSRLVSLQPSLMTVLNRFRKKFKGKDSMILVVEPGRACLLREGVRGLVEIKSLTIGAKLPEELDILMARESIMHGSQNHTRPYLIVSGYPRSAITAGISGKFEILAIDQPPSRAFQPIEASAVPLVGISG